MCTVGGDIFIHAKSSNYSKLYELAQLIVRSFPEDSIDTAQDIYGWTYQEGRDLSGFIDGQYIVLLLHLSLSLSLSLSLTHTHTHTHTH